ncbi:MAG: tRNA glutamyl-Q(34) synthetase GluQRS [Gemmatimonadetes bacterium]|nr:tRNA glutamyl-Q(34) synthetase GluQRS [Gemmatimonadota bacterium]MBP7549940.1 hypothetical protein [Gemmatimonadaceae bacterium]MCC6781839.1 tRNA glutamyl-Q(34) synthetase GluQRS [Planctomycetota bacterium]
MSDGVRRPALDLAPGFTTRFAPAPTGYLHLGHAVNAVWVWGIARAFGGRVLLRIEDHDRGRCHARYEHALLDDLDWLGLEPDGFGTDAFRTGPLAQRQSDGPERYAVHLSALEARGLAYACRCSRSEIARATAESGDTRYPGTCRAAAVARDSTPARRVVMRGGESERFDDLRLGPQSQDPDLQCGDVLVRDRAGNWTYQFAVVVDDLDQGVDVIIRGEDLLDSTGRQLRLARLLGRREAPRVLHHPLLRHPDGRKLSKSARDTGLRELRAAGRTRADILGLAAHVSGLASLPTPLGPESLADLFR